MEVKKGLRGESSSGGETKKPFRFGRALTYLRNRNPMIPFRKKIFPCSDKSGSGRG